MNLKLKRFIYIILGIIFIVGFGIDMPGFRIRNGTNLFISIFCFWKAHKITLSILLISLNLTLVNTKSQ